MFNNRIQKEIQQLTNDILPGICVLINNNNIDINKMNVIIDGPMDTPYEHGKFELTIEIPKNYPINPPNLTFNTYMFRFIKTNTCRFMDSSI